MIVLLGGTGHTGKTFLAQKILERYSFPYTSLDHIKMGLVRGYRDCGFQATDDDAVITLSLWGIVKGIIETCLENEQNILLEGCYLPPHEVAKITGDKVIAFYLVFTENYIRKNFHTILEKENVIERRKQKECLDMEDYIAQNKRLKMQCDISNVCCFEIDRDYETQMQSILDGLEKKFSASDNL